MKIENYEESADTFTFPNNSTSFDDTSEFEFQRTDVPFDNKHIFITKGSLKPKTLSLQGYFTGASKETNWRSLLEKCASSVLKKFYFATDRFYIVLCPQFKKTHTGGRANFIDYVGSFLTPVPFVFADTQQSDTYNGSWADGSKTNGGSHKTFIEEIVITFSGSGSSKVFSVQDAANGGLTISGLNYDANDILTIKLITMVDSNGYNTTEYWYSTFYDDSLGTTTQVQRSVASGKSELDITLAAGARIDTLSFTGNTLTNYSAVFKWRDSNLS